MHSPRGKEDKDMRSEIFHSDENAYMVKATAEDLKRAGKKNVKITRISKRDYTGCYDYRLEWEEPCNGLAERRTP